MPYWIRRVYAGKTVEIKKYYSRKHKPKEKRAKLESQVDQSKKK